MRSWTGWLVAGILALPALARAQAVVPAELAGTWAWRRDGAEWGDSLQGQLVVTSLTIDPNGTFAYAGKIRQPNGKWRAWGIGWQKGTWRLAADTLQLTDERLTTTAYRASIEAGQLVLWDWLMWDAQRRDRQCAARVFERLDSSASLTVPAPAPITIRVVDLSGTWAGTSMTPRWGSVTDTLFFSATGTYHLKHYGWDPYNSSDRFDQSGNWTLGPGDKLMDQAKGMFGGFRIVLRDRELIPCHPSLAVLKRVAP